MTHKKLVYDPKARRYRDEGRYANNIATPPEHGLVQLHADIVPNHDLGATPGLMRRVEAIDQGGYVPAVTTTTRNRHLDKDERSRTQWWDSSFTTGEYGGAVPSMPDDYTPKMSSGRSTSGHRRTTRRVYESEDLALRMPAVASVKRFFAENEGGTFDIPYTAHTRDGEITGHVRVTRSSNGYWSAKPLGLEGDQAKLIANNVGHLLESRRPTMALQEYGAISKRHHMEQGAILRAPKLGSSFIKSAGYDRTNGVLMTQIGEKVYAHKVPEATFHEMVTSRRPGAVFNQYVKSQEVAPVKKCDTCGRFYPNYHRCPGGTVAKGKFQQKSFRQRQAVVRARLAKVVGISPKPSSR